VQGQYRPVRAGVSCAAVRSGVAKHASRQGRGLAFGLYLNRDAGILSGGVGAKASTGLYVQASPVRRCVLGLLSTHRDMVADCIRAVSES
jgi:hypothetical protein